jgi:DNA-binding response OmpR family regulator
MQADDNADMRAYLARILEDRFAVETCPDGMAALSACRITPPDLVLTDEMMPGMSGFALLKALRSDERTREIPVVLLSARAGEEEMVEGLEAGADDYLVKPFAVDELIARLRALQRRLGTAVAMALTAENASFDPISRMLTVDGNHVPLSRAEAIVVERFMRGLGRVVTKEQLAESIYSFNEDYTENAVEVHVHRVRRKLESSGATPSIKTVRGLGYIMVTDRTA